MNNFAWFLACTLVCCCLFGLARLLGFKSSFNSAVNSVSKAVAISPLILVTSMVAGIFGAPVLCITLSLFEALHIIPTIWLRTMSMWLFALGSIVSGYLMLFCWIWIENLRVPAPNNKN